MSEHIFGTGKLDRTTREHLARALWEIPLGERPAYASALRGLLELLARCPTGKTPLGFCGGSAVGDDRRLRWAAQTLGYSWTKCIDPDCPDRRHVTLLT